MNTRDWRRLNEAAGILMTTTGMDPTRAIIEAARQLGLTEEGQVNRAPTKLSPIVEKERL